MATKAAYLDLTKRTVHALRSDNPRGTVFYDSELRGFCVRVASSGTRTFWVRFWRKATRKWEWRRIGELGMVTVEEARGKATEILAKEVCGVDTKKEKAEREAALTFAEWSGTYLKDVAGWKRRPSEDRLYLTRAAEDFGAKLLPDLSTDDIKSSFEREAVKRGRTTANRWLSSVSACLKAAWREKRLKGSNPAAPIRRYRENEARERTLTDAEMVGLLKRLDEETDPSIRYGVLLLIETGARESELLRARWSDIDEEGKTWRLPSPKAGHPQTIPLHDRTLGLLNSIPRSRKTKNGLEKNTYIIRGRDKDKPMVNTTFYRKVKDVFRDAGLGDVRVHDLRRTFGLAAARTAGLHVASKLLRHADVRVTERVYVPLGIDDLRSAAEGVSADRERRGEVIRFKESTKGAK